LRPSGCAAIHHAFTGLRLAEVVSFTMPANHASQAVMRKLGLRPAGRIERLALPHVLLRLTRERWEADRTDGAPGGSSDATSGG
jgi:RimJ/RimL family protein N-acetyltransferase